LGVGCLFDTMRLCVGSLHVSPGRVKLAPQVVDFAQPRCRGSSRFYVRGLELGVGCFFDVMRLCMGSLRVGPGRVKLALQVVDFALPHCRGSLRF
jgi:hypothetical protein